MTPSELREWILTEHTALRTMLDEIDDVLGDAAVAGLAPGRLHRLTERLKIALEHHLDLEDSHLVPVLRTLDVWGPDRAARVATEHERQRSEIEALHSQYTGPGVTASLAQLDAFVRDLRRDMDIEERTVLAPELLRDDSVVFEQIDG
jgi:hypothetical protein